MFGVGLGMPLYKQRRYLLNLFGYHGHDDQRRLNYVVDELERMSASIKYGLMRQMNDKTIEVNRSILRPMFHSSMMHYKALTACKRDLLAIIKLRDGDFD